MAKDKPFGDLLGNFEREVGALWDMPKECWRPAEPYCSAVFSKIIIA
jgi:hypothetical protein